ncbi:flagellar biosynthetic protein FliR [Ferruginivarius sediminum]|uniref:Flagellar biosynthetic protein FliR n=1 Tax=Ferruginivarius sediminum TaxID=2661937 RepID=A0A369T8Z9_9PROT|nr:flagellar biosynthetic protein FliR [Ferruginivarius sediminum]RDD60845.1 flagellar type III secretion system protein FliR [Ferruginivarius sediminum]
MLQEVLPASLFAVLLVFVRVGAAMMQMPGIGDPYVSPRARLLFALLLALAVTPVLSPVLPGQPESVAVLFVLLAGELFIGFFLGALAKVMMSALVVAGMVMAYMSALANALVNDPAAQQQGSIAGSFLNVTALVLIFALNLHHLLIGAVVDSYAIFPPGDLPPVGDFSQLMTDTVARAFLVGIQLGAPFMVVGLVLYLGMGLLGRLMPQVQIFFVGMPLQIALGISLLMVSLPVAMAWFMGAFEDTFIPFTSG